MQGQSCLQGGAAGFNTGNIGKLSSTRATPAWVLLSSSLFWVSNPTAAPDSPGNPLSRLLVRKPTVQSNHHDVSSQVELCFQTQNWSNARATGRCTSTTTARRPSSATAREPRIKPAMETLLRKKLHSEQVVWRTGATEMSREHHDSHQLPGAELDLHRGGQLPAEHGRRGDGVPRQPSRRPRQQHR